MIVDADDIDDGKDRVQLMFKKSSLTSRARPTRASVCNPGTGGDLDADYVDARRIRAQ